MDHDRATGSVQRFECSTSDESETEDFISRWYIGNRARFLSADENTSFTAKLSATEGLAVSHLRATVNFRALTEPFDYFLFLFVTNGRLLVKSGRDDSYLNAGAQSFYPLGVPLEVDLFDMGVRTLQLSAERLASTAEHSAGLPAADFRFESATPLSAPMARQWSGLMDLATTVLLAENAGSAPILVEELTRTAAITALHTFPNTALTADHRPRTGWVAPAAVRRAAEFIQTHADQPIGLDQIATAAGVGGRALQQAFRRHFGVTPIQFLRRVRLELADQQLRAAGPDHTVTVAGVARRWGWTDPKRFAADYRRRFGLPPSGASP
jgi:AraC-like DNA-binding protein